MPAIASAPRQRLSTRPKAVRLEPFLSRITLAAAEADQPRASWAQLLRTGAFYDPRYGDFSVTKKDLATMAGNFATKFPKDPTKLAIDYNHGTSRPNSAEEGKAAGWILDVELRANGDELWGRVEWTEQAASMIEAKEYQFVSATFSFDYTNSNGGEDIGPTLLAAAVTNRPVVHGMQPLALSQLGAKQLDAATDDEVAEALFSFDEIRRRVQAALTEIYGSPFAYAPADYYSPCRGVYLESISDGFAIFCNYESEKFRIDYAIGSDGSVTFTSEPVEVRVSYEPLTAPSAEEQNMSVKNFKVKDVKGNEVELAEQTVIDLAKANAPKAADPVELAALKGTVEAQGATILSLQESNKALELAAKQRDAEAEFETLLKAGKVNPTQKDTLVKLALANAEMFKELTATMPVIRQIETVTGSGADTTKLASNAALDLAIAEEQKANPKLTKEQAYAAALDKNPKLYEG